MAEPRLRSAKRAVYLLRAPQAVQVPSWSGRRRAGGREPRQPPHSQVQGFASSLWISFGDVVIRGPTRAQACVFAGSPRSVRVWCRRRELDVLAEVASEVPAEVVIAR